MKRRRTRGAQFALSFAISFGVLVIPLAGAVLRLSTARGVRETVPMQAAYRPQASDALTILAAGREGKASPGTFVLMKMDPLAGQVTLAVLPPETMVEDGGKFDALSGVWRKQGAARAVGALASALGVRIDRWVALSPAQFIELADIVGTVDYPLAQPLTLADGSVMLTEGRQLLDGRKMEILISHTDYAGGAAEQLRMTGDLLVRAVDQRLPLLSASVAESIFKVAVNASETNLTVTDFESRRRAGEYLRDHAQAAQEVAVAGEYNAGKNTFLLSGESITALLAAFG